MRMTVSLPDTIARRFFAAVPSRQRSATVARLIEEELKVREAFLESACLTSNSDLALAEDIEEWQSFDDSSSVERQR